MGEAPSNVYAPLAESIGKKRHEFFPHALVRKWGTHLRTRKAVNFLRSPYRF